MATVRLPLITSYNNRAESAETGNKDIRLINCFKETINDKQYAIKRPGLTTVYEGAVGTGQGVTSWQGNIYHVSGGYLHKNGVPIIDVALEALSAINRVDFAIGQDALGDEVLFMSDRTNIFQIEDDDTITAGTSTPTVWVAGLEFYDGYLFVMGPAGAIYNGENAYNGDSALDFSNGDFLIVGPSSSPASPVTGEGNAKCLKRLGSNLVAFRDTGLDFVYDAGNPTGSPLGVYRAYSSDIGCISGDSVIKTESSICWLGRTPNGGVGVYILTQTTPEKISTPAIDKIIEKEGATLSTSAAFHIKFGGHALYVISFNTIERTLVYDLVEKEWYEFNYFINVSGTSYTKGLVLLGKYLSTDVPELMYGIQGALYGDNKLAEVGLIAYWDSDFNAKGALLTLNAVEKVRWEDGMTINLAPVYNADEKSFWEVPTEFPNIIINTQSEIDPSPTNFNILKLDPSDGEEVVGTGFIGDVGHNNSGLNQSAEVYKGVNNNWLFLKGDYNDTPSSPNTIFIHEFYSDGSMNTSPTASIDASSECSVANTIETMKLWGNYLAIIDDTFLAVLEFDPDSQTLTLVAEEDVSAEYNALAKPREIVLDFPNIYLLNNDAIYGYVVNLHDNTITEVDTYSVDDSNTARIGLVSTGLLALMDGSYLTLINFSSSGGFTFKNEVEVEASEVPMFLDTKANYIFMGGRDTTGLDQMMAYMFYQTPNGLFRGGGGTSSGDRALIIDYANGKVYEFSQEVYTDDGVPITTQIITDRIDGGKNVNKVCNRLEVIGDYQTDANDISLQWSDDDYKNYSTARTVDASKRMILSRLGRFQRRSFKLTHEDPTALRLEALELDIDAIKYGA